MQGVVSRTVPDLGSRLSALRGVGNGDGAGLGWAGLVLGGRMLSSGCATLL